MHVIDNMNAAYRNDVLKFGTSGTKKIGKCAVKKEVSALPQDGKNYAW